MKEAQACVPFAKRMSTARFAVSMQRIKWLRRLKPPSASSNAGCQSPSYSGPARKVRKEVVRCNNGRRLPPPTRIGIATTCAHTESCQGEVPQVLSPAALPEELHPALAVPWTTRSS